MKKLLAVLVAVGMSIPVFAQANLPEHSFASGSWAFSGPRLYQNDAKAPLAKVNIKVAQSGPMVYAFNAEYEGGAEDGHAGFGIHLFADNVAPGASWGSGKSYLLWLNYDEKPMDKRIPAGLSAQVYKSLSNSRMELVQSIDLNQFKDFAAANLNMTLPVKLWMDGNTGEVRVYDPTLPTYYYYFYVDKNDVPMKGSWVALRTNGVKLSFGLPQ
jgi:hypothetical protein